MIARGNIAATLAHGWNNVIKMAIDCFFSLCQHSFVDTAAHDQIRKLLPNFHHIAARSDFKRTHHVHADGLLIKRNDWHSISIGIDLNVKVDRKPKKVFGLRENTALESSCDGKNLKIKGLSLSVYDVIVLEF